MTHVFTARRALGVLALLAIGLGAGQAAASRTAAGGTALTGTFKLTAGSCGAGGASGSYFRMIYPGGTIKGGKFFQNPDSTCSNKSFTLVAPGTAGGLVTGAYQPSPAAAFDAKGNAKVATIVAPAGFTAIKFGLATLAKDPKTGQAAPSPSITVANGKLSGQVEALWAEWNHLYFNQGSPKPGGKSPGLTQPVSGTYNATTHAFVLTWASSITGGPFNGFTGYWHLSGTFTPR
jgi:hypothetical protein